MPIWVNGRYVMRSPIAESGRSGVPTKINALSREPGNTNYSMGDLDNNQFQPNINYDQGSLQGDNVAIINEAVPNGEDPKKHLSTFSDEEKKWLVQAADEERSRGKGFMFRLKQRWDRKYPNKNHISKQNLRDNALRIKQQIHVSDNSIPESDVQTITEQETTMHFPASRKWTNDMKINLLKIHHRETKKGRGFMRRMKEAWDTVYDDMPISAQTLRDNTARFQKDKDLLNLLEVRDGTDVEPEQIQMRNITEQNVNEANNSEEEEVKNNPENEGIEGNENGNENEGEPEDEETREMKLRFEDIFNSLKSTMKENMEERERLAKLKKGVPKAEIERANRILEKKLENTEDICKVVDAVYAMGRTIEERKGIKRGDKGKKKKEQNEEN